MAELGVFAQDYIEQFNNLVPQIPGLSTTVERTDPLVQFSILARNAELFLDLYFDCLEKLDYDKTRIILHVQTDNNVDATEEKFDKWLAIHGNKYRKVQFNKNNFDVLKADVSLTWSLEHFGVIKQLRNNTLSAAIENGVDYLFLCDVDNFIVPSTLKNLVNLNLPIVAPLIRFDTANNLESNFWTATDSSGLWFNSDEFYGPIISRHLQGVFKLPLVHCTYLIKSDYFASLTYSNLYSETSHEYIVFAENARRKQIPMYLDNRLLYGIATGLNPTEKGLVIERMSEFRERLSPTWK
jgi:hypothetical protein